MKEEDLKEQFDILEQGIEKQINIKVKDFRESIYNTYGIKLYIAIPNIKFNDKPIVELSDFWDMVRHMIIRDNPELKEFAELKTKTRLRDFIYYYHAYNFLSRKVLGYTYKSIGKCLGRNHASIVHSVKQAKNLLWCEDDQFMKIFNELKDKLKEYVETISEDTKVRDNS